MDGVKIRPGDRVIVCDGRKALLFENIGNGAQVNLKLLEKRERSDAMTADMGTDAPGRVHSSVGSARSSVEQTDWHEREEQKFLRETTQIVEDNFVPGAKHRLVVVAPPRAMAILRNAWSKRLRESIMAEINKDLAAAPMPSIESHFLPSS